MRSTLRQMFLAVLFAALASPMTARACAVCYGEPDSPMTRALTWAITALALIVLVVLGGVVAFFVQSNRRASHAQDSGATPETPAH